VARGGTELIHRFPLTQISFRGRLKRAVERIFQSPRRRLVCARLLVFVTFGGAGPRLECPKCKAYCRSRCGSIITKQITDFF